MLIFADDCVIVCYTVKSKGQEVIIVRINREKLAVAMVRHDLNGKQLAEKAGISRITMTAVRSGKSCSMETAEKLISVLGPEIIDRGAI